MLGRALVARAHKVTVIGLYKIEKDAEDLDEGVRVIRLAKTRFAKAGFLINGSKLRHTLERIHAAMPIDVLEGAELSMAMVSPRLKTAKLIRMNGGHHFFHVTLGQKPRAWRSWLERRSFAKATHLCAVSQFVGETTKELLNLGARPVEVIPNPVDVSKFKVADSQIEENGLIAFVGTVCEKKGVRQLVNAMPQILSGAPHARLWIIGRDTPDADGVSFTEKLKRQIAPEHRERIEFKGAVNNTELPAMLARAQLCAYPSHMEALPLAWLEGMAMGKAVVASKTGPGAEVIQDNISGLLCDPHDSGSIAVSIIKLLNDDALRERMGAGARERVETHFSIDVLVERNIAFYHRCLNGHLTKNHES